MKTLTSAFIRVGMALALLLLALASSACGNSEIQFVVKHILDRPGEVASKVISYDSYPGLDNSKGAADLQVQLDLHKTYHNQIVERLTSQDVSAEKVRQKIAELYKLSPVDPEGTQQKALCPLSVIIPAGSKGIVTVEWTERWAEGVISEGAEGEGDQLGAYKVFLGYVEPCSLVKQENIH